MLRYKIDIEPDDNETLLVTSADIPIVTFGDDRTSALEHAHDAVLTVLAGLIGEKLDVPLPDYPHDAPGHFVDVPLPVEMKLRLYTEMRKARMRPAQLQNALGWKRESVDRLFRLNHASRVDQIEEAFHVFGKHMGLALYDRAVSAEFDPLTADADVIETQAVEMDDQSA